MRGKDQTLSSFETAKEQTASYFLSERPERKYAKKEPPAQVLRKLDLHPLIAGRAELADIRETDKSAENDLFLGNNAAGKTDVRSNNSALTPSTRGQIYASYAKRRKEDPTPSSSVGGEVTHGGYKYQVFEMTALLMSPFISSSDTLSTGSANEELIARAKKSRNGVGSPTPLQGSGQALSARNDSITNLQIVYSYSAMGRITNKVYSTGLNVSYNYDAIYRMTGIINYTNASPPSPLSKTGKGEYLHFLSSYEYTYDKVGNQNERGYECKRG